MENHRQTAQETAPQLCVDSGLPVANADPRPRPAGHFAAVDEQGRLVLPAAVLRQFGMEPGAQVYFDVGEDSIRLRRPMSNLARIYVELTNRCNMDCEMCQRRTWPDGSGDMTPETLTRVLEGIAECDPPPTVVLGGFGEPLMHRDAMDFIERCKALGSPVELITNGRLLDADRVALLRSLELDRLWLSVDGFSEAGHGHPMSTGAHERLISTVRKLNPIHYFAHKNRPRVGLVFVAMKDNVRELPRVLELARHLYADKVLVSNLLAYTPEMSTEILYRRAVWRRDSGYPRVKMPRIDLSGEVVEHLGEAMRHRDSTDLLDREYADPFNTCPFMKTGSVAIRWDGGVSPCLPLLHSHVSHKGEVSMHNRECLFGSLRERRLLDIWADPEYEEFRRRVTEFQFAPCVSCASCDLSGDNEEDCLGNPFPTCGDCLWAQGLILCP